MTDQGRAFVDFERLVTVFNPSWRDDDPFKNQTETSSSLKWQKEKYMHGSLSKYEKIDGEALRNCCTFFLPSSGSTWSSFTAERGFMRSKTGLHAQRPRFSFTANLVVSWSEVLR